MKEKLIAPVPSDHPTAAQLVQIRRRFGMFIHFGMGTFTNEQISKGTTPIETYSPVQVDAAQWAQTALEAGMKYIILVTKHCEGFAMWDTATTDYSVAHSPCRTDVCAALSEECAKRGLGLGFYYSLSDDHHPAYKNDYDTYFDYMCAQLTELLDGRYGNICELWLDCTWEKDAQAWRLDEIYDLAKHLQPDIQVGCNHTIGVYGTAGGAYDEVDGIKGRYLPANQQALDPIRYFPSDFRLVDPEMPSSHDPKLFTHDGKAYYLPFEATICSREGFNWFYSDAYASEPLKDPQVVADAYHNLITQDDRLVINLAPARDGRMLQADIDNLMRIKTLMEK